jgi:hypothetical protein
MGGFQQPCQLIRRDQCDVAGATPAYNHHFLIVDNLVQYSSKLLAQVCIGSFSQSGSIVQAADEPDER